MCVLCRCVSVYMSHLINIREQIKQRHWCKQRHVPCARYIQQSPRPPFVICIMSPVVLSLGDDSIQQRCSCMATKQTATVIICRDKQPFSVATSYCYRWQQLAKVTGDGDRQERQRSTMTGMNYNSGKQQWPVTATSDWQLKATSVNTQYRWCWQQRQWQRTTATTSDLQPRDRRRQQSSISASVDVAMQKHWLVTASYSWLPKHSAKRWQVTVTTDSMRDSETGYWRRDASFSACMTAMCVLCRCAAIPGVFLSRSVLEQRAARMQPQASGFRSAVIVSATYSFLNVCQCLQISNDSTR